jgi:hypothetical protein
LDDEALSAADAAGAARVRFPGRLPSQRKVERHRETMATSLYNAAVASPVPQAFTDVAVFFDK